MSTVLVNIGIVLALIIVEGVFVAGEISMVSLREGQVRTLEESGRRGQRIARLVSDPNRFLAATQIGVTLTAIVSSAFGAVTLSASAGDALRRHGVSKGLADALGFLVVTLLISYVTLVVGELAPKRLALQRTEGAARTFGPFLDRVATVSRPVIWLLSKSTDGLVRLLGGDPGAGKETISEEELRGLVAAHESLGDDERRLIDEVFAARESDLRGVMIPRTEVVFLDESLLVAEAAAQTTALPHSRYPVMRGSSEDDVVGFVHVRDLLADAAQGRTVGAIRREVRLMPGSKNVLAALSEMRREGHHLAIVVDEYGGTAGIVTLEDLIEEVIGDIRDEYDPAARDARRLRGGDVEVAGLLNLNEFEEVTGIALPDGPYETAAGFVVNRLGHLPQPGETVETEGARISVTALDGRRVERLRVHPVPTEDGEGGSGGSQDAKDDGPQDAKDGDDRDGPRDGNHDGPNAPGREGRRARRRSAEPAAAG